VGVVSARRERYLVSMERPYIDIYCERVGPEFWSEPVNALTNLAFIVSASLIVRMLVRDRTEARRDAVPWFLAGLVFTIGVGSWLFHTLATRWALLADIIPIALFILVYTWYALRRFAFASPWICGLGVVLVLGVAAAVPPLTGFRGGPYVSALLALVLIGGYLKLRRQHPGGGALLAAAGVFAVSLALRTLDQPVCAAFPTGTHFAWHLLNATVLFIVVRALILYGKRV
jgi:hypothetical protein